MNDFGSLFNVNINGLITWSIGIGDVRGQELLPIDTNTQHFLPKIVTGMTALSNCEVIGMG